MRQVNNKGFNNMRLAVGLLRKGFSTLLAAGLLVLSFGASAVPLLYDVRYNPLLDGETEIEVPFWHAQKNPPPRCWRTR